MAKRIVYVVDDEEAVRKSLKVMLAVSGYAVTVFDSGAALLNVAEALVPGSVLLDIRMPDMDGIEVQRRLLDGGIEYPVVVMTGHGDLSVAASALRQGAVAFLEKPFAKAELVKALDAAHLKLEQPEAFRARIAAAAAAVEALGDEDRALLAGLAAGRSNETIAAELAITTPAAEIRRGRLLAGMGAETLNEALWIASAAGLRFRD